MAWLWRVTREQQIDIYCTRNAPTDEFLKVLGSAMIVIILAIVAALMLFSALRAIAMPSC